MQTQGMEGLQLNCSGEQSWSWVLWCRTTAVCLLKAKENIFLSCGSCKDLNHKWKGFKNPLQNLKFLHKEKIRKKML